MSTDFEERKMEYDFNKFCRESCEEILSLQQDQDASIDWKKSEIVYSDMDHTLVRFDDNNNNGTHIYFKVFHSENDDRYEAVPVALNNTRFVEVENVADAIRRDD